MVSDIEKLEQKRQKNVQEQCRLTRHEIMSSARWFREKGRDELPGVVMYLEARVPDLARSLVLHTDMRGYEQGNSHKGILVTDDRRFFEYELDLSENGKVVEWHEWTDVTTNHSVSNHVRGIGESFGYSCVAILDELNGEDGT